MTSAVDETAEAVASPPASSARKRVVRHLPFAVVLAAGIGLRILAQLAYQPAFISPDSRIYFNTARTGIPNITRPSGYAMFLRAIPHWQAMWPISVTQHAMALLAGVLIYVVLLSRRVPAWAAALAAAPVLLDPWQIAIEHFILTDVPFQVLLLAGLFAVVIKRRLSLPWAITGGLLIGFAMTVRGVGQLLLIPVVLCVLLGQARWRPAIALTLAALVAVGAHLVWYHNHYGRYALSRFPAHQLYGRVAPFVDCAHLSIPSYERSLCPTQPPGKRPGSQFYTWSHASPRFHVVPPPGKTQWDVVTDFDLRVLKQQTFTYARLVTEDVVRGFAPTRSRTEPGTDPTRWTFGTQIPELALPTVIESLKRYDVYPKVNHSAAVILRDYREHFYVPGPLFAACLLCGLLATAGVGRARRSGLRSATALFTFSTLAVLIVASAVSIFSWRYQIPQFVLLPPAGALGLTAMLRRDRDPDALTLPETLRALAAPLRDGVRRVRGIGSVGRHVRRAEPISG
jgi:4-amino-4-deoxy-L-arabinose transferase-like glycosyltransferase